MATVLKCKSAKKLPRRYFDSPECQFCPLGSGCEGFHVQRHSQSYLHAVLLFASLVQCLAEPCGAVEQHVWDMVACLSWKRHVPYCAVAPDSARASFLELPGAKRGRHPLRFTWPALVHVRDPSLHSHLRIPRPVLVPLTLLVVQGVVCELLSRAAERTGTLASAYVQEPRGCLLRFIGVVLWLLRSDPRLVLHTPFVQNVHLPGPSLVSHSPYAYAYVVRLGKCVWVRCRAAQSRQVNSRTCAHPLTEGWNAVLTHQRGRCY